MIETVPDRPVIDHNRMTGSIVTVDIDFGLELLAELRGEDIAKINQLMIESNPKPTFNIRHPDTVGPEMVAKVHQSLGGERIRSGIEIAKNERGVRVDS